MTQDVLWFVFAVMHAVILGADIIYRNLYQLKKPPGYWIGLEEFFVGKKPGLRSSGSVVLVSVRSSGRAVNDTFSHTTIGCIGQGVSFYEVSLP
jgi:hypothetical protein